MTVEDAAQEPLLGTPPQAPGDKPLASEIRLIPVASITPDPDQPRRSIPEERIERLAESIRVHGLLHSITVFQDVGRQRFCVISGECRLLAVKRLGWTEVEVRVIQDGAERCARLSRQLAENMHRNDLLPSEIAKAYQRFLQEHGWTVSQVAAEMRVALSTVTKTLALLDLRPHLLEAVDAGRLPPSTAYELTRLPEESRDELADLVLQGRKTRTEVVAEVHRRLGKRKSSVKAKRVVFPLDQGARVTVSAGADLDWENLLAGLGQLTSLAKKVRAQGNSSPLEELARLCANKGNGKKEPGIATSVRENAPGHE